MAIGDRFVKIVGFFVDNTSQALLADQLESSGMAAWFGKLSTKKHHPKFKTLSNINKNVNVL